MPSYRLRIERLSRGGKDRLLRIPSGKTKAARRTLRLTVDSFDILKRRIQDGEESEAKLKAFSESMGKRLNMDPQKIAAWQHQRQMFVFPAHRLGKRCKGHI